jgi:hypothetical protein
VAIKGFGLAVCYTEQCVIPSSVLYRAVCYTEQCVIPSSLQHIGEEELRKMNKRKEIDFFLYSYVLVTVHRDIILINNQVDAQFLLHNIYFDSLHVSSNLVLIIRRVNCINTTSGICHSV